MSLHHLSACVNIINNIKKRSLKEALDKLRNLLYTYPCQGFIEQVEALSTTYSYLLEYLTSAAEDPQRELIYQKLIRSTFELTEDIVAYLQENQPYSFRKESILQSGSSLYLSLQEQSKRLEDSFSKVALAELLPLEINYQESYRQTTIELDNARKEWFLHLWLSGRWSRDKYKEWKEIVGKQLLDSTSLQLSSAALTLSLMERLDEQKALALVDLSFDKDPVIAQRGVIGLFLIVILYNERLEGYPSVTKAIESLFEQSGFENTARTLLLQIVRTFETEKLSNQMAQEIMPQMASFQNKMGSVISVDDPEALINPDWQKMIDESGITDKIQKIQELQLEGSDIYLSTFSHLKHFDFFKELHRWFLPFDKKHPLLHNVFEKGGQSARWIVDSISDNYTICNSDKYSFCLTLQSTQIAMMDQMFDQLKGQEEALKEMIEEKKAIDQDSMAEKSANQYVQDLFRFFRLHPKRNEFPPIFDMAHPKEKWNLLSPLFDKAESLKIVGEFCFQKKLWTDSIALFEALIPLIKAEEHSLWYQKIGYAFEKEKKIEKAIEAYLKAELIDLEDGWILQRLASLYQQSGQIIKALSYYLRVEQLSDNNPKTLLQIGHCFLHLSQYEKALSYYYKCEFIHPRQPKIIRPLAWTLLLSGKTEQALSYYQQLITIQPSEHDYLNSGHAQWLWGNKAEALQSYLQSEKMFSFKDLSFFEAYQKDIPDLIICGMNKDEIPLILDLIRLKKENTYHG